MFGRAQYVFHALSTRTFPTTRRGEMSSSARAVTLIACLLGCAQHGYGAGDGWGALYTTFDHAVPASLLSDVSAEIPAIKNYATRSLHKNGKATTFWRPFGSAGKPRFAIEVLVDFVTDALWELWPDGEFAPGGTMRKSDLAGVEWWVQARTQDEPIGFHYDKDESKANEHVMVPPHMSSVFYLNDCAAPTLILNQTTISGNDEEPRVPIQGVLSYPRRNKYILFGGALMHGVPPEMRDPSCTGLRETVLINYWSIDKPPVPPNCIMLPDADIAAHMPQLNKREQARKWRKKGRKALHKVRDARLVMQRVRAGELAADSEEALAAEAYAGRLMHLREHSTDALVAVPNTRSASARAALGGGPDAAVDLVNHRLLLPPENPMHIIVPRTVYAQGETVKLAWGSEQLLAGVHELRDHSAGYLNWLRRNAPEPKVVVVAAAGAWRAMELDVMLALRPFANKLRVLFVDSRQGGSLARDELGVEADVLPSAVLLFTHYENGQPRVGGERVVTLHAWRKGMRKAAKKDPSLRPLASRSPTPELFAKQLDAFARKHLAQYVAEHHGPQVDGVDIGQAALAGNTATAPADDDDDDDDDEYSDDELFGEGTRAKKDEL